MVQRILVEPFVFFFANPGVGILLFPAAAAFFSSHRWLKPATISFLYLLGIHWLGSTSIAHYSPLPADPRMWVLISMPLILLAGIGLETAASSFRQAQPERWVWAGMVVVMLLLGWCFSLPGVLVTLISAMIFVPIRFTRNWAPAAFACLLLFWLGYNVFNKDNRYYQQREIRLLQDQLSDSAMLYADPILAFSSFLYETEGIGPIRPWPDGLPENHDFDDVYFLWNGFRTEQANLREDRIVPPSYFDDIRSSWELVGQIEAFEIRLYKHPISGQ